MQKPIYGKLYYNNKTYPFILEDHIVFIVQQAFEYRDDFKNFDNDTFLYGVTSNNAYIVFLNSKISQTVFQANVFFSIQGYILYKQQDIDDFGFDKLAFYSDALNVFYSPQKAIKQDFIGVNGDEWDGSFKINIQPSSKTNVSFEFDNIKCDLDFHRSLNLNRDISEIGNIKTVFSFEFKERIEVLNVAKYYLMLFDFLSFANNSKNLSFSSIKLIQKEDDHFLHVGDATIFSKESTYSRGFLNTITFDDLPQNKLGEIFEKIVQIREKDNRLTLYFPENEKESNWVDASKWLQAAISFEGLFSDSYPNFKVNTKGSFKKAKQLSLEKLEAYMNANDFNSLTKKEKQYYVDCKKQIENYEGLLEEKFNFFLEKYKVALSLILDNIYKTLSIDKNCNLGKIYSDYRNKLAHGKIEILTPKETAIYRILRAMIYILLLEDVSLSDEQLAKIINKVFK